MKLKGIPSFLLFTIGALTILVIGLFSIGSNSALDINVHDTYFVIHQVSTAIVLAVCFLTLAICYWAIDHYGLNIHSRFLKVHVVITLISIPVYWLGIYVLENFFLGEMPSIVVSPSRINLFTTILLIGVLLVQAFFFVSLFYHIIKSWLSTSN